jgi:hypothetical protein
MLPTYSLKLAQTTNNCKYAQPKAHCHTRPFPGWKAAPANLPIGCPLSFFGRSWSQIIVVYVISSAGTKHRTNMNKRPNSEPYEIVGNCWRTIPTLCTGFGAQNKDVTCSCPKNGDAPEIQTNHDKSSISTFGHNHMTHMASLRLLLRVLRSVFSRGTWLQTLLERSTPEPRISGFPSSCCHFYSVPWLLRFQTVWWNHWTTWILLQHLRPFACFKESPPQTTSHRREPCWNPDPK